MGKSPGRKIPSPPLGNAPPKRQETSMMCSFPIAKKRVVTGGTDKVNTSCCPINYLSSALSCATIASIAPPPIYNNKMLLTKTTLLSSTFTFSTAKFVREVAASGGSTNDLASIKAARKLRRGKECSPSFQIEKNADEIDNGILKTCPENKVCIEDITSSLGGRCVASGVSSVSIRSLSSHESIKIQTSCTFANGTIGVKCEGYQACANADITTTFECGSCIGKYACFTTGARTTVAENSCLGDYACYYTGNDTTVAENSCLGNNACYKTGSRTKVAKNSCIGIRACRLTGADTTVAENSCLGDYACYETGDDTTVAENSCIGNIACASAGAYTSTVAENSCLGDRACSFTGADTTIGKTSCVGDLACRLSTFVDGVVGNCQW
jgi:hypothetical protein